MVHAKAGPAQHVGVMRSGELPFREWSIRADLYSGGHCDGAKVGPRKESPIRPNDGSQVYWINFQ